MLEESRPANPEVNLQISLNRPKWTDVVRMYFADDLPNPKYRGIEQKEAGSNPAIEISEHRCRAGNRLASFSTPFSEKMMNKKMQKLEARRQREYAQEFQIKAQDYIILGLNKQVHELKNADDLIRRALADSRTNLIKQEARNKDLSFRLQGFISALSGFCSSCGSREFNPQCVVCVNMKKAGQR